MAESLRLSQNRAPLCTAPSPCLREKPGPLGRVAALWPGPAASLSPGASLAGDGYYLAVGGAVAQHNWCHISSVLQDQKFRCQLIDSSEDLGMISIQGPAR